MFIHRGKEPMNHDESGGGVFIPQAAYDRSREAMTEAGRLFAATIGLLETPEGRKLAAGAFVKVAALLEESFDLLFPDPSN